MFFMSLSTLLKWEEPWAKTTKPFVTIPIDKTLIIFLNMQRINIIFTIRNIFPSM